MLTAGAVLIVMSTLLLITRAQASPPRPSRAQLAAAGPGALVAHISATGAPISRAAITGKGGAKAIAQAAAAGKTIAHGAAAAAATATTAAAAPPPSPLVAYQGLGTWVSLYDYDETSTPINPAAATAAMQSRGVQTMYLQTSRWNLPNAIDDPAAVGQLIDDAHAHGIRVVGWYLPGFANNAIDVQHSVGVLTFTTPKGGHFDGLALDIEDKTNFGSNIAGFDAGVTSFSRALRAAVGPHAVLGAIVPDAVNDRRSPQSWAGFPWPEIAHDYDVVLPMGYWSVQKPSSGCGEQYDAAGYTTDVYHTTISLMGTAKPMAVIGGIGDCDTLAEIQGYVQAVKATGMIGASIYTFETVESNPAGSQFWPILDTTRH